MGAKLSIELDRPNHFFTEADVVSGHVVVESDTSLSLQRLTVIRQWRAEGGREACLPAP